jgi:hypothetical protein
MFLGRMLVHFARLACTSGLHSEEVSSPLANVSWSMYMNIEIEQQAYITPTNGCGLQPEFPRQKPHCLLLRPFRVHGSSSGSCPCYQTWTPNNSQRLH